MTPDDEIVARMLHLPSEKNKPFSELDIQSVKVHTAKYKRDKRSVYDILGFICKDTDLYPNVKQNKSKRDGRGVFDATHSRWVGPNHVNATASEAKSILQMSIYDGEKKA